MQIRNSLRGYGIVAASAHWLTMLLVVAAWLLGTFGDALPRGPVRSAGVAVHISIGLAILALAVARLAWRRFDAPPLPLESPRLGRWATAAASLAHVGLYALLIVTPHVGVLLQFARGQALPIFGIVEIASPLAKDRDFAATVREIHETLGNGLMILAALHAAAAMAHHWILRDDTLGRMLPGRSP
jgi:cytochrome b561